MRQKEGESGREGNLEGDQTSREEQNYNLDIMYEKSIFNKSKKISTFQRRAGCGWI